MSSELLPAAEEEARGLSHHWLGGEHLALALTRGPGVPSEVLASLGVRYEALRARVVETEGGGEVPSPQVIPLTPRSRRALDLAAHEAQALRDPEVRQEHVLLALVHEGDGLAVRLLEEHGADAASVRSRLFDRRSDWGTPAPEQVGADRGEQPPRLPVVAGAVVAALAVGWAVWNGRRL